MKGFKKTYIAASVAAMLAVSSSVAWADAASGMTTSSQTVTVDVVYGSVCHTSGGSQWEASSSSGWYPLYAEAAANAGAVGIMEGVLGSHLTADITFNITQQGLNGVTNQVDLAANIDNVQYAFGYLANGFNASLGGGIAQNFTEETLIDVYYWGIGVEQHQAEGEQKTSISTSVKGTNITEFNSSLLFNASGFEAQSLETIHSMVLRAAQDSAIGDAVLWTPGYAMAYASAISDSKVTLKVDARYNKEVGSESNAGQIIIDDVSATVTCGGNSGSDTYFDAMTNVNANDDGGIIIIF